MRSTNGAASSTSSAHALANGEIRPFYQPIVDPTGKIIAVEALVRWVHPIRGVLGVNEILPLAQMAGLAEAVDDCVLDAALDFAVQLAEAGHGDTEVHINVDPKVIAQPAFGVSFLERCRRAGANPTQLVVEITETDLLAPGRVVARQHAEAALRRHPRVDRRLRHGLLEPRPPARTARRRREDRPPLRGRHRHRPGGDEPDHGDHRAQREPASRVRRRGRRAAVPARPTGRARLFSVPGLAVLAGGRAGGDAGDDAAHRAASTTFRRSSASRGSRRPTARARAAVRPRSAVDRSSASSVSRTDAADRRPRPTSTSVPTMLRTIWWQNDVAAISKRVIAPKCVSTRLHSRDGDAGERDSASGCPGWTSGRRQNDEKSCSPISTRGGLVHRRRDRAGRGTCHDVRATSGFGSGWFQTS